MVIGISADHFASLRPFAPLRLKSNDFHNQSGHGRPATAARIESEI
jgi:hypothetical protein